MHKINHGLIASNFTSELLAIKEALILYLTHLELSGTTERLAIFSDSRAAVEAIIKGDTNITSAINVLLESLHCKGKSCLLKWIPAHVNIEGNECADSLAKEGRNDDQLCPTITLADANAVANYRLLPHRYKKPLIVDFDCSRNLTSIIARLRTGHFKVTETSVSRMTVSKRLYERGLFARRSVCVPLTSTNRKVRLAWHRQQRLEYGSMGDSSVHR
ncbi:RNase H domain-containing protein [Trichonephila clavipes]|nr:RNase H domain-containing protein [Trichonephila clavipes]